MDHVDRIIADFRKKFHPYTVSVAEAAFSRFMAGDGIAFLAKDYNRKQADIVYAIRFFVLKTRNNLPAMNLYNEWQAEREKDAANYLTKIYVQT